jgi:cobalt-zinc-cadmium efflux system outer membrane protein
MLPLALVLLAAPRPVSFDEARAAALAQAPEVRQAEGRAAVALTEVRVVGALPNPTLALTSAVRTAKIGSTVGVPLLLFGQRATAMRAARADADAAALDTVVSRYESRWAASTAWVDLWQAEHRAELLALAAADSERLLQIAQEKYDAGSGSHLDVVRTRADRARALAESSAARHAVTAAGAVLALRIGAEPSQPLTAAGGASFSVALPALDALIARLADQPTMARDRTQVDAAARHTDAERRARWPAITPQLTVNAFDPTVDGTDFIFGLSLDLPVLDQRGGAIDRAEAQRRLAELGLAADERRLRGELIDAHARSLAAADRLRALRSEVVPALEQARKMTEEGFRSGRLDLIHLLDTQRAFIEARLAEVEAEATFSRAAADVERALGTDLREVAGAP